VAYHSLLTSPARWPLKGDKQRTSIEAEKRPRSSARAGRRSHIRAWVRVQRFQNEHVQSARLVRHGRVPPEDQEEEYASPIDCQEEGRDSLNFERQRTGRWPRSRPSPRLSCYLERHAIPRQHNSNGRRGVSFARLRVQGCEIRSPPLLPSIFLVDGHLTKTRGGKMRQISRMVRFCVSFQRHE
jgi:hypothetical protein